MPDPVRSFSQLFELKFCDKLISSPIITANVAMIDIQPLRETRFKRAGDRNTAAALAAEIAIDPPKYK